MTYKSEHTKEAREAEASKIRKKYPDRIPIIVERAANASKSIPDIDKKKFLVPSDLSMGQFQYVIRKRVKMNSEKAMFVFINNKLISTSTLLSLVYDEHKDEDGFLYVTYCGENTFG